MSSGRKGFTLIELLIVVAIIGIITAISVINYFGAIQRARQKRTMADMRGISVAVDSYNIDFNSYPVAAAGSLPFGLALPTKTLGNVGLAIVPTYIQVMPFADGWNSWFTYDTTADNGHFVLRSSGSDGAPQSAPEYGPTTDYRDDIIFVDNGFVQYPQGIQTQ